MLSDKTVRALNGASKATLKQGVRIKHLFRMMTHFPDLWMQAYANIYANKGALTAGTDGNTLDGMSEDRINRVIQLLKDGKYKPEPARRVYVLKKNGKLRPLGIPSADDKLVQEVVRMLLELIFEPIFSQYSHGFRPKRSCHTALLQVRNEWKGIKWIVDMDISGFYDNIDHDIMIGLLEKKIDDKNFIELIKLFLHAGYLEDWKFNATYTGTPQGGICSPILANIFLHELDQFMEKKTADYNKGKTRRLDPTYFNLTNRADLLRQKIKRAEDEGGCFDFYVNEMKEDRDRLRSESQKIPSRMTHDEDFRRLRYVRYADDFAIGMIGPKADAQKIADEVREFLKDLKLQIAEEKSGIRNIKEGFRFLGYNISLNVNKPKLVKSQFGRNPESVNSTATKRACTAIPFLQVPKEKVWEFCKKKGYIREGFKATSRPSLVFLSDYEIVETFNAEMRGFMNYYALAPKVNLSIVESFGLMSLFKTLAHKHRTTSKKIRDSMKMNDDHVLRYEHKGKQGTLRVFKLKYRQAPNPSTLKENEPPTVHFKSRTEILDRINAGKCEYCGTDQGPFEVHHIRKLADLAKKNTKQPWEVLMCARNRKTMVLCKECHQLLHSGQLQGWRRDFFKKAEMESAVHGNVHAAFGGGRTSSPVDLDKWVENKPISD